MSYFGDNTPQQELLDQTEHIQEQFELTDQELVTVVLNVLSALVDPYDDFKESARKKTHS